MRLRGLAVVMALLAGLLQAGPLVACTLACGSTCPMHAKRQSCCDAEKPKTAPAPDCKCMISAPDTSIPGDLMALPAAWFQVAVLPDNHSPDWDSVDNRSPSFGGDVGPPGVAGESGKRKRAPPMA